jgi:uncharacterized membrane protein YoaK (UPF0700 family)
MIAHRLGFGRRWFTLGLLLESVTVGVAGVYALATGGANVPTARHATVVFVLLSLAMGWRNRVVLQTRIPEMPTTLVQASLIKLVADFFSRRSPEPVTGLTRAQRLSTVLGMFAGGLVGAAVLPYGPGPVLLAVAGCVAAVALVYARSPRLRSPAPAG